VRCDFGTDSRRRAPVIGEAAYDGNVRRFVGDDVGGWPADVSFFRQSTRHVCVKHGVDLDGAFALDAKDLGHASLPARLPTASFTRGPDRSPSAQGNHQVQTTVR
jgi:hypothetical protein